MAVDAIRNFLQNIHPLNNEELEGICADWQLMECKRKTILTASYFLRISHTDVQERSARYPAFEKLLFKATAFALKGALERYIELQAYSNEEKFRTLLRRSPHILQLVPQKCLASYLGMDATNLSKLLGTDRL
jgi:hypothetical protein